MVFRGEGRLELGGALLQVTGVPEVGPDRATVGTTDKGKRAGSFTYTDHIGHLGSDEGRCVGRRTLRGGAWGESRLDEDGGDSRVSRVTYDPSGEGWIVLTTQVPIRRSSFGTETPRPHPGS